MHISRFFIYGLLDPDTYEVKYIGKSAQGISRFNHHLQKSSLRLPSPKNEWIKGLLSLGKLPLFKILEICPHNLLNCKEAYWIAKFDQTSLLNVAKGGEGGNTGRSKSKWKSVYSKNIETGLVTYYDYVWATERDGFQPSKVCAVCLGKRKTHNGHYFSFSNCFNDPSINYKPIFNTKKPIRCLNKMTNQQTNYDSIKDAAYDLGLSVTTISNHLRGKTKCRNYLFAYEPINKPIRIEL